MPSATTAGQSSAAAYYDNSDKLSPLAHPLAQTGGVSGYTTSLQPIQQLQPLLLQQQQQQQLLLQPVAIANGAELNYGGVTGGAATGGAGYDSFAQQH